MMLNKEKYAKEIVEAVVNSDGQGVGLKGGEPFPCRDMKCDECDLSCAECEKMFRDWANSEYVEPSVDWNKVAVDTPILVRDSEYEKWEKRYFAKYDKGVVYAYNGGSTSWSVHSPKDIVYWECAKLAESEGE